MVVVVGQPFCFNFSGHFLTFQDIVEHLMLNSTNTFTWWNEICSSKIGSIDISRILFAAEPDPLGACQRISKDFDFQ